MLSIYLFCLTFSFVCWLQYTPRESQEGQSNTLGAMEPLLIVPAAGDPEALIENQSTASISGWDVIEVDESWHGWTCPLPMTTPYWGTDELQTKSIRQLKKLAAEAHIKRYGVMNKIQLVEALLR
jgi:hypothetical protein